jgi:hypothetical protein
MDLYALADDRPDDGIQTGAITAARQHTYAHGSERIEDASPDVQETSTPDNVKPGARLTGRL